MVVLRGNAPYEIKTDPKNVVAQAGRPLVEFGPN
jgi:hypothetical protein